MPKPMPGRRFASLLFAGFLAAASLVAAPAIAAAGDTEKSESYLRDAQKYLDSGQINAAIIQLKNALQNDPNNIAARELLARVYLGSGNGPYAEKELRAIIRQAGDRKEVHLLLAEARLMQGKFELVLRDLKDDNADPALRARTLLARGRAHLGLERLDEALASFTEAERLNPENVSAKVATARALLLRRKPDAAEIKIDEALTINPRETDALVLKGELRRIARDLEGAATYFGKAVARQSNKFSARLGRAAAMIDLNRMEAAEADVRAVTAVSPRHPLANYLLAVILAKRNDYSGAQDALLQGGPALQNHYPSIFLKGAISYSLNQLENAVNSLTRYIEEFPENRAAVKLLAASLVRANEPQKVIRLLEPHLEQGANDAQILTLAASAYMRVGDHTKSAELFAKAAEISPNTASIHTQLALSRLALGRSELAIDDLQTAISLDPEKKQASMLLALVQLREKKFDDALHTISRLRKEMSDAPLPDNLEGAAYLGKGQLDKARKAFGRALAINPDFHPARMNLARIELLENNTAAAIAEYERIVGKDPKNAGAMIALSAVAETEKRPNDAFTWLRRAIDANPKSVAPPLRLIRFHMQRREMQRAVVVARDLAKLHPRDQRVLEALGRSEMAVGDFLAAATTFRRLVDVAPKSAAAFTMLAGAQSAAKNIDAARQSLQSAVSLDARYTAARLALARLEMLSGRSEEARSIARKMIDESPDSAMGYMLLGDIEAHLSRYDAAVRHYDTALQKEDLALVATRRFETQRRMNDNDGAFGFLQSWVDRRNDRRMRHFLASAYIAAQRFADAIRESEKLLSKDQDNAVLLNNLAWLYDRTGDERAIGFAERALKQAPNTPAIMDTVGWILLRGGEPQRAISLLAKANELAPQSGNIAYHYAVALHQSGRTQEARRRLKKLLGSGVRFSESDEASALLKQLGG